MAIQMPYQAWLEQIAKNAPAYFSKGKVADYIPALAKVPAEHFGMAISTVEGEHFSVGDAHIPFSIQSISKVFTLALAFDYLDNDLWKRVGIEPSGTAFNSLVQLEYENGIPRNPFINAGSIVVADALLDYCKDGKADLLAFINKLSHRKHLSYDAEVADSERVTGYRNFALANFMKSFGNIHNSIDQVLDLYFHHCSIRMNCLELADAFLFLANHGCIPHSGERILSGPQAKRINAIMLTCGTYDEAGEFAFRVGLPGKSGVGGGIVAIIPGKMSIAVWSPALNDHGNSAAGIYALETFTTLSGLSIF